MALLDWLIVGAFIVGLVTMAFFLKQYCRSVADFLAANRTGGRYMLSLSGAASACGGISIVAGFEIVYLSGFSPILWGWISLPVAFLMLTTGWVTYRFRETRALTLAQFFEMRYSRRFRIFMGIIAFISGVVNMGIFPAVTAHFFIYFCGLPEAFTLAGLHLQTYPILISVELGLALLLVNTGGQVTILILDFLQGQFINIVFVLSVLWLLYIVSWSSVSQVLLAYSPAKQSMINPFHTSGVKDFNVTYYIMSAVIAVYSNMAWQGGQAFNSSARTPHEGRMGNILSQWRSVLQGILPAVAAISAFTVMHHPDFHATAQHVQTQLNTIPNSELQTQATVPLVLRAVFPVGLMGLFVAMMLSASVSTDGSYMHSWGSIFIQDVISPLLKKPLEPEAHLRALRWAMFGVVLFIFCFSVFFQQNDRILLFQIATGAIFIGGAGSAIIGGLYWKKGTALAAWVAMITGSTIATFGVVARDIFPNITLNGQHFTFIAVIVAVIIYVTISLIQNREYNIEKMLHRGKYHELLPPAERNQKPPVTGWATLAPGPNFTRSDLWIYWLAMLLQGFRFGGAALAAVLYVAFHFADTTWLNIWHGFIVFSIVEAVGVTLWFLIGGYGDLKRTLSDLGTLRRVAADDGTVTEADKA